MVKVIECEQGTQEWAESRRGLITASRMGDILPPVTMKPGDGRKTYMYEMVAENIVAPHYWVDSDYKSRAMENGSQREPEARRYFSLVTGLELEEVGLIVSDCGRYGASPDSLVKGRKFGLELKCPLHKTQVKWLANGGVPKEHLPQCHGGMIVAEYEGWFFLSYAPGLPPILEMVRPDGYQQALRIELPRFHEEYISLRDKILNGGDPVAATRAPQESYW